MKARPGWAAHPKIRSCQCQCVLGVFHRESRQCRAHRTRVFLSQFPTPAQLMAHLWNSWSSRRWCSEFSNLGLLHFVAVGPTEPGQSQVKQGKISILWDSLWEIKTEHSLLPRKESLGHSLEKGQCQPGHIPGAKGFPGLVWELTQRSHRAAAGANPAPVPW